MNQLQSGDFELRFISFPTWRKQKNFRSPWVIIYFLKNKFIRQYNNANTAEEISENKKF